MENKSGVKLLKILEYIVYAGKPLRLIDISRGMGMNQTTTSRYLSTLINNHYIVQEPSLMTYMPTYKLNSMANHANSAMDITRITHPFLERISKEFGESVCLSSEENMQAVYIDVMPSQRFLATFQQVGGHAPLHCTGNGKVLLLNYSSSQIDDLVKYRGLAQYTPNTITNKETLLEELNKIRERGYALDEEERELGVRCVAVPIYDSESKVITSLSITGPTVRMTDELIQGYISVLKTAAVNISKTLGLSE